MVDFVVAVRLSPQEVAGAIASLPKDEAAHFARMLGRALIAHDGEAGLPPGDFIGLMSKTYWQERKGRDCEVTPQAPQSERAA